MDMTVPIIVLHGFVLNSFHLLMCLELNSTPKYIWTVCKLSSFVHWLQKSLLVFLFRNKHQKLLTARLKWHAKIVEAWAYKEKSWLCNSPVLVIEVMSLGIYYNSVVICKCVWLKGQNTTQQVYNKWLLNWIESAYKKSHSISIFTCGKGTGDVCHWLPKNYLPYPAYSVPTMCQELYKQHLN